MLHIETPLIESRKLGNLQGHTVLLKMECAQPTGSFKLRGIGHACEQAVINGAKKLVASSGGNAGYAVAYSARKLGVPADIVVPIPTSQSAKNLIAEEGANIIVDGASWIEAHQRALTLCQGNASYIHPFDDPAVWQGHTSMIEEIARAGVTFDAVVLSVGGGGLLAGVVQGLHHYGLGNIPVFALETTGANSFAAAIAAGNPVTLPSIHSIATTLGAKRICDEAFAWTKKHTITSILVSDKDAVTACLQFLSDHRVVVEPACGAALAPLYLSHPALAAVKKPLVIVCGGVGATVKQLQDWEQTL